MNDFELRIESLRLANVHSASTTLSVQRAQSYYDFLQGKVVAEDAHEVSDKPVADPGVKRGRKSKAVEEALASGVPNEGLAVDTKEPEQLATAKRLWEQEKKAEPVAADAVDYKQVQLAVVGFVQAQGKGPALEILRKFGVETALDLKTEQYAAVLKAFEAANNEAPVA